MRCQQGMMCQSCCVKCRRSWQNGWPWGWERTDDLGEEIWLRAVVYDRNSLDEVSNQLEIERKAGKGTALRTHSKARSPAWTRRLWNRLRSQPKGFVSRRGAEKLKQSVWGMQLVRER